MKPFFNILTAEFKEGGKYEQKELSDLPDFAAWSSTYYPVSGEELNIDDKVL